VFSSARLGEVRQQLGDAPADVDFTLWLPWVPLRIGETRIESSPGF
jgi:hypothetical protein